MEHAIVHQDSSIYRLMMDKYLGIERGQQEVSGFRVQVYSSNLQQRAKNESILLQQELEKKLSKADIDIYLCHCQNVLFGNLDGVFLTFNNK